MAIEDLKAGAPSPQRRKSGLQRAHGLLTSPKLAIALLVTVLLCCVVGVTLFSDARAWELIYTTLWFNALLVLLAVSSAAAFFTRIWRRKLTVVSVGMILFHVSFATLLGGAVYNSLFRFRGVLRLTEGETLPNGDLASYDRVEHGRFFDVGRLRGETTLVKVHPYYTVDGQNKRAGYELAVADAEKTTNGVIYVTQDLEHNGVRYLCSKEGYSVLVVMSAKDGTELYGAHVPLQSVKQPDGSYLYTTGTATTAGSFAFPPPPDEPRTELLVTLRPSTVKAREGEVGFQVVPMVNGVARGAERNGRVLVGGTFDAGEVTLSPREVRFWVGMDVRYDPGLDVILGSLCTGLLGMFATLVGRVRQGTAKARASGAGAVQAPTIAAAREETT